MPWLEWVPKGICLTPNLETLADTSGVVALDYGDDMSSHRAARGVMVPPVEDGKEMTIKCEREKRRDGGREGGRKLTFLRTRDTPEHPYCHHSSETTPSRHWTHKVRSTGLAILNVFTGIPFSSFLKSPAEDIFICQSTESVTNLN